MIQRASDIGELASAILAKERRGRVSRAFPGSAYVRTKDDFLLLLWGRLRSPSTLNVMGGGARSADFEPGAVCELAPGGISAGETQVKNAQAQVFRSSLLKPKSVTFPKAEALTGGIAMLVSLYDVAPGGEKLVSDGALQRFVNRVMSPLAGGDRSAAYDFKNYMGLVGRGGGFTPAGDDFLGGFLATFNFVARQRGRKEVSIPQRLLFDSTVPESAAMLSHAAGGYVDEAMEGLILSSTGPRKDGFHRELLSVARRGHTSGIDMSLGVMLCEAALSEDAGNRGTLAASLDVIWGP